MKNINDYRKNFADLRDSILMEIFSLIKKQPNWYMKVQDVQGKLAYNVIDDQESEIIQSVTVKDHNDHGEKAVVWIGVYEEDGFVPVEDLDIDLMINVLEAMQTELN